MAIDVDALPALIASAERILHATGNHAVLCSHLRHPPHPSESEARTHTRPPGLRASGLGMSAAADSKDMAASSGQEVT